MAGRVFAEKENKAINSLLGKGLTLKQMQDRLEKQGIQISLGTLSLRRSKLQAEKPTAQEELFKNRTKVVQLFKDGFTKREIAEEFGVQEEDVNNFLSKRKRLDDDEKREIIYKASQGSSMEELAEEYGVHPTAIKKIVILGGKVLSREKDEGEEPTRQELDLNIAKNFIKFINQLMTTKKIYTDDAEKLDKKRQDILHELEMKELSQDEKLEMLDKIQELSRMRREMKDYNEIFEPVFDYLKNEDNMNTIKTFANRVAEAVNKLKDTSTRVYFIRSEQE